MAKRSKKKEKAIVDYRHRWPTQQTLYESRVFGGDTSKSRPISRRQDDIDRHAELIESRKRKQFSTSTQSESPDRHKPILANSKPGRSTHPYDTGVGETSATTVGDINNSIRPRTSSKHAERIAKPRRQSAHTPDGLRKSDRLKSTPSPRDSARGHTPQKRDHSNLTPESQTKGDSPTQLKIAFRNILRLDKKNWCNNSNTDLSETASIIPLQTPAKLNVPMKDRRRRIWKTKKQESIPGDERDQHGCPESAWRRTKSSQTGTYQKGETCRTNAPIDSTGKIPIKLRRGTKQTDQTYQGIPKTTNASPSQPDRDSLKKLGRKLQIGHRKSVSSSQAHQSTIGTSSTPGAATAQWEFAQESWSNTPSPTTLNQVLRFLFGPRRTPPSRTATSLDLPERPKISVSASSPVPGRLSRGSRAEGRPSVESRNKGWIPFRISPRSQLGPLARDGDNEDEDDDGGEDSGREERGRQVLESTVREPTPGRLSSVKKPWDRILRKRWRSG
ncbi:hypothetical protein F5B19DRAFT_502659 [Rostrohypoxylon terebratum]|nr:hypothetical protein F5B19DRAFT_502659 [Rostrohypoxylon terebratum]